MVNQNHTHTALAADSSVHAGQPSHTGREGGRAGGRHAAPTGPAGFSRGARRPAPTHLPQSEPPRPDSQEGTSRAPRPSGPRPSATLRCCHLRPATGRFSKRNRVCLLPWTAEGKRRPWRPPPHPDCPRLGAHGGALFTCVQALSRGPLLHLRVAAGASRPFSWLQKSLQPRKDYRQKGFGP